ncbi:MAG: L,D-transpeptidase [Gammaproteobacteria bacterium]|nr:MAG: L,D-transpeptidase [Gammaproteobacteria bacterium]
MKKGLLLLKWIFVCFIFSLLISCTNIHPTNTTTYSYNQALNPNRFNEDFASRLPPEMDTNGKKMVLVDPNVHAWGAYDQDGHLVRAGIATAGGATCPPDDPAPDCRTGVGTFHITSMRGEDCYSKVYPKPHGGGLMPYCMYFNNGEALHGSPDNVVIEANVSHGCVRMRIQDAQWMQENFAQVGTTVKVLPYNS